MGIAIKQTQYVALPAGPYRARIGAINGEDGKFGPQLRFKFYLVDGEQAGQEVIGWSTATFSPRSKLYAWAKAAFGGREIPETYDLNTDHLVGKLVILVLGVKAGDDGAEFNRIEDVRPATPVPAAPAAAPGRGPVRVNMPEPIEPAWPQYEREDDGIPF